MGFFDSSSSDDSVNVTTTTRNFSQLESPYANLGENFDNSNFIYQFTDPGALAALNRSTDLAAFTTDKAFDSLKFQTALQNSSILTQSVIAQVGLADAADLTRFAMEELSDNSMMSVSTIAGVQKASATPATVDIVKLSILAATAVGILFVTRKR